MPPQKAKARVLMVDDDPAFLDLARCWLEPRCEVFSTRDGAGLLDDMDAFQPDLVVLDVCMPAPDGFTLCRRIRQHPKHAHTPVLFLTASGEDADFVELLRLGNGYLGKPPEPRALLTAVRDLIARWPVREMIPGA